MADCGALVIWEPSILVSGATDGCTAKVTAAVGGEVKLLFWRTGSQAAVLADKTPASSGDSGCTASDAMGACHEA